MPGRIEAAGDQRFPRGVLRPDGARAVVRGPAGRALAIDLADGSTVWRADEAATPIAVVRGVVVAVRTPVTDLIQVVLLDERDGRLVTTCSPVPLPAWVRTLTPQAVEVDVTGTVDGDALLLRWWARARYRGGAAPGPGTQAAHRRSGAGQVRVHLPSGRLEPVDGVPPGAAGMPAPDDLADDARSTRELGARRFELADEGSRVLLRASDPAGPLWETPVDEPARRPPPPRP